MADSAEEKKSQTASSHGKAMVPGARFARYSNAIDFRISLAA
jgi:hypothetical protein